MSPENPTDRFFREKLGNYASKPPMHVWEQIDRKRTQGYKLFNWVKQRKMRSLLALLLLAGIAYWGIRKNAEISGNQHSNTATLAEKVQRPLEIIAASNSGFSEKEKAAEVENNSSKSEDSYPNSLETNEIQNATSASKPLKLRPPETLQKKTPLLPAVSNRSAAFAEKRNDATDIQPKNPATEIIQPPQRTALTNLTFLPFLNSPLLIDDPVLTVSVPTLPEIEKKRPFSIYLDLLVSPDLPIRSLEARSADNLAYKDARANTESVRYAFSGGFRLSFVGKRGLAFRSGLMYAQINERFDYQNENAERVAVRNAFDTRGTIIGTDTLLETGFREKRTYNRFHLLDIPIIAGYELNTRRWAFSVNGGLYVNLLFRKKGDLLSPENEPATFSSGASDALPVFKNRAGFSLFGSFGLNYKFSDNVHWVIEPHLRYYLNPLTREDYLLEQKYLSAGLLTGLRFKF